MLLYFKVVQVHSAGHISLVAACAFCFFVGVFIKRPYALAAGLLLMVSIIRVSRTAFPE